MTLPTSSIPHITVQEEDGEVRLLVVRAQGLLGRVLAEFRTVPLTAFSPEDYQVNCLILWKWCVPLSDSVLLLEAWKGLALVPGHTQQGK